MTLRELKETIDNTDLQRFGNMEVGTLNISGIGIDRVKRLRFYEDPSDGITYILMSND